MFCNFYEINSSQDFFVLLKFWCLMVNVSGATLFWVLCVSVRATEAQKQKHKPAQMFPERAPKGVQKRTFCTKVCKKFGCVIAQAFFSYGAS